MDGGVEDGKGVDDHFFHCCCHVSRADIFDELKMGC